jgi:hypothetical protein
MRRPERAPQTDLAAMLEHCRTQYGNALFTALTAYHGDIFAVWNKIVGKDHNEALLLLACCWWTTIRPRVRGRP